MKKLFHNWMLALLVMGAATVAGCSDSDETDKPDPPKPTEQSEMAIEVVAVESGGATLKLTTKNIATCAYTIATEASTEIPQPVLVFRNGEEMTCTDGENTIAIGGKQPNTTYYIYIAGMTTGNTYHEEVLAAEFTTPDIEGFCSLMEQYYDGYSVYVNLPAEVKERGNVLRYNTADVFFYNYMRDAMSDYEILITNNGQYFGDKGDTAMITYNDKNIYLLDENGDLYEDELGQNYMIHNPIVPGEPTVLIFGEFSSGTDEFLGNGYYAPMFDLEGYWNSDQPVVPLAYGEDQTYGDDPYWTGFHTRFYTSSKAPEKLDAKLNISIHDVGATNARIRIDPDPEIKNYWFVVLDDYNLATMKSAIDNREEYLQWFITSFYGSMSYAAVRGSGKTDYMLRNLYTMVDPNSNWNIVAVGMSDEIGTAQCMETATFSTGSRTKPRPEVVVKHVPTPEGYQESSYYVWFNVKCPSKDAVYGMYAADYDTEWQKAYTNKKATNAEIIGKGNSFTNDEIAQINTDEGLTFAISTLDGMTTRCGVILYNDEDYPNNPDDKMSEAIADAYSPYIPDKERVDSELFTKLEGEWTLTARASNCKKEDVVGDWIWYELEEPLKSKVTISNGVVYPEVLPQEVYDAYAALQNPVGKEEVDNLYAGFCEEADAYNARLRGQNRLLCVGINDAVSALTPMTAFDGFYKSGYDSYDIAEIFYDFGPKWYLEIDRYGNVTAPFNYSQFVPASNWITDHTLYMAAIANTADNAAYIMNPEDYSTLHFPVEVSADGNTITVKCLEFEVTYKDPETGENKKERIPFYPNAVDYYYNSLQPCLPKYISEWTLTRGWDENGAAALQSASFSTERFLTVNTGNADLRRNEMHQLSRVAVAETEHYKQVEYTPVTFEESQARTKAYFEKRLGIKNK